MTRRRLVWVVAVCLAVPAGASGQFVGPPHPVNYANYQRVKEGMTRAQVDAILGQPARVSKFIFGGALLLQYRDGAGTEVFVQLSEDGRVEEHAFVPSTSFLVRLSIWIGR